eukprot:3196551-Pyramimonas_sp.AAC.1
MHCHTMPYYTTLDYIRDGRCNIHEATTPTTLHYTKLQRRTLSCAMRLRTAPPTPLSDERGAAIDWA